MKTGINIVFMAMFFIYAATSVAEEEQSSDRPSPGDKAEPMVGMVVKHNAIESTSLRISLDNTLHGFIEGKVCDFCKEMKVTITPETKAYEKNVEVPLKRAKERLGRYATVIYEIDTKKVSAIRW